MSPMVVESDPTDSIQMQQQWSRKPRADYWAERACDQSLLISTEGIFPLHVVDYGRRRRYGPSCSAKATPADGCTSAKSYQKLAQDNEFLTRGFTTESSRY
jgi:hypothetical protein